MNITDVHWKELIKLKGEALVNKSTELRTHWLSLKLDKIYTTTDAGFHSLVGNVLHEGGHHAGLMVNYEAMFDRGGFMWDTQRADALRIAIYKLIPYLQMAEYIIHMEQMKDKGKPCPDCEGMTDDPQYTCTTCWCQGGDGVL